MRTVRDPMGCQGHEYSTGLDLIVLCCSLPATLTSRLPIIYSSRWSFLQQGPALTTNSSLTSHVARAWRPVHVHVSIDQECQVGKSCGRYPDPTVFVCLACVLARGGLHWALAYHQTQTGVTRFDGLGLLGAGNMASAVVLVPS